jgi:hypothetical protein
VADGAPFVRLFVHRADHSESCSAKHFYLSLAFSRAADFFDHQLMSDRPLRNRPPASPAVWAEQAAQRAPYRRDEIVPVQLIEIASDSQEQERMAEYRIGKDESAGVAIYDDFATDQRP